MMNRKLIVSIMAGLLALIMILSLVLGFLPTKAGAAQSSSAIQQQLDKLKAQKEEIDANIAELEGQLSGNLTQMEQIVAQKNTIDQEIFALHQQVANINEQIAVYNIMIADQQVQLEDAEARLAELNEKNKERIRAMEEQGDLSYWSVLFQANDFVDFLDRMNMVNEIAAADERRLREMNEAAETIATVKAELETKVAELETTKKELDESQKALEEKRIEADALLAELIATGEEYQALLHKAEEEAAKLGDDIEDKQDAYDEAKRQEWLSTSVPSYSGGTAGTGNEVAGLTWLLPCNYVLFTSPFGWREDPIYGGSEFHYGVDLAGPSGTPIVATRAGVITTATYDGACGYYVVMDHQDGYTSKYLHMTHYIVQPGQTVTAGQVIGYMGSTGASTGSHLHFSILYNGSHVNPALYINI